MKETGTPMQPPRTLGELLADAEVLRHGYEEEEIAASRRRIERDIAELHRRGDSRGRPAAPAVHGGRATRHGAQRAAPPWASSRHGRAAGDLRHLSAYVLHTAHAARHIGRLATSHQLEPEGALIFACLLHLSDREEVAEFLWQFSAGAGKTVSALCLHLLHLQRGELRDARHWARQASALENHAQPADGDPRPDEAPEIPASLMLLRTRLGLAELDRDVPGGGASGVHGPGPQGGPGRSGGKPAGPARLSRSLTAAVQRLVARTNPYEGSLPWPDRDLALRLEHCGVAP
ncbi:hypothetical protein KBZ10_11600 [Streptomyces sp. F63]|uniref:hypothetical protein n=1 Tax=Streptomyces sp. F63 TaxID=2824887 RepID=UPI001B3847A4|nr:hypothetical protein [Streptomyces sp. F63]MBQ0985154.1 hypothetical protein [Streptomyces sp. F63]